MWKRGLEAVVNLVFYSLIAVLLFGALRHYVAQPFQVDGHSMEATLLDQEHLFLLPKASIERFDVVVFPDPRGHGDSYIKRVIGLPGDRLRVENDQLYLNDQAVAEPYLEPMKSQSTQKPFTQDFSLWDTIGQETVPEGYYFVMGDNRPRSGDSRQFGLVPIDSVKGEANFVYLPFNRMRQLPHYQLNADGSVTVKP